MALNGRSAPIIAAGLAALLAFGCDARTIPAEEKTAPDLPAQPQAPAGESIIRESVRAEAAPEPEAPEPVTRITIPFGENEDSLPAGAADRLARFVTEGRTASCYVVRGHTDSTGSDLQNLQISERRAKLVRDRLVDRGIATDRIRIIALGERRPLAPNATADGKDDPEGRAQNRRVTVDRDPANEAGGCGPGPSGEAVAASASGEGDE